MATTESPVAISTRRATGFDLDTLHRIPAATLRGALASIYLRENGPDPDADFRLLFLSDLVRYRDLRVRGSLHWPLSARECSVDPRHARVDLLIAAAVRALPLQECATCKHKRRFPQGFRLALPSGSESVSVQTRRVAHVQIDDDLRRASGGLLHSSQMIETGQIFEGRLYAEPCAVLAVTKFLGGQRTIWIGRGKTRGQGRVTLKNWEAPRAPDADVLERLRKLNRKIAEFPPLSSPNRVCFTIGFQSPAIVYDKWLLSRTLLAASDISGELSAYRLLSAFTRSIAISGWHANAGLPKSEVSAIAPGSSFLFGRDFPDSNAMSAEMMRIAPILAEAQIGGIGERVSEGFGEALACDSFHFDHAGGDGQ